MKKLALLFSLALLFATTTSFAQLSKAEKKEWKKKAKEYAKNPANLKQFTEDKQTADNQVATLNKRIADLQKSASDKDARIADLEDQLAQARTQLSSANAELAQLKAAPPVQQNDYSKGVVFKVQIGAFKNKDLSKYFEKYPNLGGEVKPDGTQTITLCIFRDYWDADTFKKYMREMGVKDAWIVPYKDGQRVDIKDVLDSIGKDPSGSGNTPK